MNSTKKPELSKVYYVDQDGNLCRKYTFWERVMRDIGLMVRIVPPIVTIILLGLLITEICLFVGLYNWMLSPVVAETNLNLKVYIAPIALIGVILFISGKAILFFVSEDKERAKLFFKSKKSKKI
jgi:hypothetical protein